MERYIKVKTVDIPESLITNPQITIVGEFAFVPDTLMSDGYFSVSSVHRDDLNFMGLQGDIFSDDDMRRLADKMSDDYCDQLFWESLKIIGENIEDRISVYLNIE